MEIGIPIPNSPPNVPPELVPVNSRYASAPQAQTNFKNRSQLAHGNIWSGNDRRRGRWPVPLSTLTINYFSLSSLVVGVSGRRKLSDNFLGTPFSRISKVLPHFSHFCFSGSARAQPQQAAPHFGHLPSNEHMCFLQRLHSFNFFSHSLLKQKTDD